MSVLALCITSFGKPAPIRLNPPNCSGLRATINYVIADGFKKESLMNNLRDEIKRRRRHLNEKEVKTTSKIIVEKIKDSHFYEHLSKIGIYFSINNEVNTKLLIEILWSDNKNIFLPIVNENKLLFGKYTEDSILKNNKFNIPEPIIEEKYYVSAFELDLIFIPLVGFDPSGNRIGMGGGFYDRTLEDSQRGHSYKRPILIGIAYEFQKQNKIEPNAWDIPLDMIVTESKIYNTDIPKDM